MPKDAHKHRPRSKSGLKGVYYNKDLPINPWKAYYRHHGQYLVIGYFKTRMEAAKAYNKAILKIWGPEAYLNPIVKEEYVEPPKRKRTKYIAPKRPTYSVCEILPSDTDYDPRNGLPIITCRRPA